MPEPEDPAPSDAVSQNAEVVRRARQRLEASGSNVPIEQILADIEAMREERTEHLLGVARIEIEGQSR